MNSQKSNIYQSKLHASIVPEMNKNISENYGRIAQRANIFFVFLQNLLFL